MQWISGLRSRTRSRQAPSSISLSPLSADSKNRGAPHFGISPRPSSASIFPYVGITQIRSQVGANSSLSARHASSLFSSFFSAVVFLIISSVSRSGKSRNLFFSHRSLQKITVWNKCLILLLLVPVSPRPAPGA